MELVKAKSIISNAKTHDWFGTDYNMNIYRGCCHGCIYCDSRSECYGILNFDTVRAKDRAIEIIAAELKSKIKKGVVATGAMSDPYNPFEKQYGLTGKAAELLLRNGFGLSISTKGDLIKRDIDIFKEIANYHPVIIKMTITSSDDMVSRLIEPYVCESGKRFEVLGELAESGIFAGILLTPVLPFINDTEENIRNIVVKARKYGAKFIYPSFGVTLRANQRDYFYDMLDLKFTGTKKRYIETFGNSYYCDSPSSSGLKEIFKKECENNGILYRMKDIVAKYKEPYENEQLSLF